MGTSDKLLYNFIQNLVTIGEAAENANRITYGAILDTIKPSEFYPTPYPILSGKAVIDESIRTPFRLETQLCVF
jgi:hypothetical protein